MGSHITKPIRCQIYKTVQKNRDAITNNAARGIGFGAGVGIGHLWRTHVGDDERRREAVQGCQYFSELGERMIQMTQRRLPKCLMPFAQMLTWTCRGCSAYFRVLAIYVAFILAASARTKNKNKKSRGHFEWLLANIETNNS
ncbi:unnamed protein product, partial [Mesorhabditis spiculigera]